MMSVSCDSTYNDHSFLSQGPEYPLRPLANLKPTSKHSHCLDWLCSNAELSALLSALLWVIHPALFTMARQAMVKLATVDDATYLINLWTSIFNGCQVMSNRETLVH